MAKVVYRGVEYDTVLRQQQQQQLQQQPQQHNETYRGVKFVKEEKKWKLWTFFNSLKRRNKKKIDYIKRL